MEKLTFREMVQSEYAENTEKMERFGEELKILLLPSDPNDEKNVIVEIRGGAGEPPSSVSLAFSISVFQPRISAYMVTYLPTGLVVECQDERSQYKNKDKAMKILRSRLYEQKRQEHRDHTGFQ